MLLLFDAIRVYHLRDSNSNGGNKQRSFCGYITSDTHPARGARPSLAGSSRYYACPLVPSAGRCWLQSMDRSLPPPLLQNPACDFHRTRLLSDAPLVMGIRRARPSARQTCDLRCGAFPCWASLPHACAWVLAHVQRYTLRSLAPHRPHVSLSETLLSALAS